MTDSPLETRKTRARAWFEELQTRLIAAFEAIEDDCPGPFAPTRPAVSKSRRGAASTTPGSPAAAAAWR